MQACRRQKRTVALNMGCPRHTYRIGARMLRILQGLGVWLMTCVLQADEEAGEGEVNFEPLPFSQAPAVPQLLQPIMEVAQHQVLHWYCIRSALSNCRTFPRETLALTSSSCSVTSAIGHAQRCCSLCEVGKRGRSTDI